MDGRTDATPKVSTVERPKNKREVRGLSATYKEKEIFILQKKTSNDRSTHFTDLIVEKSI